MILFSCQEQEKETIVAFFDAHISAKSEGATIADSYSHFFKSLRNAPTVAYMDSVIDLNNEHTLALVNKHPEIWHKEYPRNYKECDTIDINVHQDYLFKLIDKHFSDEVFFSNYKNSFANSGGIAPSMLSSTLYQHDTFDYNDENVRLFLAIHYITCFTKEKK